MDLVRCRGVARVHDIHFPFIMMLAFRALALAAAVSGTHDLGAPPMLRAGDTLRVVLVVDDTVARRSLVEGARLGAEEASHTGALFGTVVTLRIESRATFDSRALASGGSGRGVTAASLYVVAGDTNTCSPVTLQSARDTIPLLDAGCPPSEGPPGMTVYSLLPAAAPPGIPGDSGRVELWHWSLERFGGEQLNQRFRRRFAAHMDSAAWAGWFAMKVALDAALHAKTADGPALLRELADPHAQYDGQKGRPLRFAPATHRLMQPVYRVAGHGDDERVIGELAP